MHAVNGNGHGIVVIPLNGNFIMKVYGEDEKF
jgi:hypothetical protein